MRKILSIASFAILLTLLFSGYSGLSDNCELKKDTDGIKVFSCKSSESEFNDIEAEFELKATSDQYIDIVMEVEDYDEWHYRSANPRLLKKISEKELIYYEQVCAPWPVSDRDVVLKCKIMHDETTKALIVTLESLPNYLPVVEDIVRISKFYSIMTLTPTGRSSLDVKFHLEVDPGGLLPVWLVNSASTLGPYETFMNLRDKLELK